MKEFSNPRTSVLVAAWNEEKHIEAFLRSFANLDHPGLELILCAGGQDKTYSIAQKWAGDQIVVIEQVMGQGKFISLQQCLARAKGEIIVLTDADCILNSESIKQLIQPVVENQVMITTGRIRPLPQQLKSPFVYCQWALQKYADTSFDKASYYTLSLYGANSAFRRSLIEEASDTDHPYRIGEDTYLTLYAIKQGHKILRVPNCYVETRFPETAMQYVSQKSRWRRSYLLYTRQFGDKLSGWKGGGICLKAPYMAGAAGFGTGVWHSWFADLVRYLGRHLRPLFSSINCRARKNPREFGAHQTGTYRSYIFVESCQNHGG